MHENYLRVIGKLREDPDALIRWAAVQLVALGAKAEWSMEDNFSTTEGLAGLAAGYGLPSAADQSDKALRFYGLAAQSLGLPADLDDDDTIGA